jgi:hypothetical protein
MMCSNTRSDALDRAQSSEEKEKAVRTLLKGKAILSEVRQGVVGYSVECVDL